MTQQTPQHLQLWRMWTTQRRLGASAALAATIAIVCIPHGLTKPRSLDKLVTLAVGLAATEAARRSAFGYFDWRDSDADLNYVEKRSLIQQHKKVLNIEDKIVPMTAIPAHVEQLDGMVHNLVEYWQQQEKHLLVVGGTGSGKTTFIRNFCKSLHNWQKIAYDIDSTVDDWKFADHVLYEFAEIEAAMKADLALIPTIREARRIQGNSWQPSPTLFIADEFPALVSEFDTAKKWLATHAKQTRKHKRMIAILSQNDTVANLGLKGDISVRDTCFMTVYLGEKAYEHAKLIGKPELIQWLREGGYSVCLVDDKPAYRP